MPPMYSTCPKCLGNFPSSTFYAKKGKKSRNAYCHKCLRKYYDDRSSPRDRMWSSSYYSAQTRGHEHTITKDDIPLPEICRYLGIKLDYRRASERGRLRSPDAPSIDRIDSTRGYVPGNIQVISDLANRMKQEATIEQLLAFAEGVILAHG